jgi:small-conductance mechanosensitive channel
MSEISTQLNDIQDAATDYFKEANTIRGLVVIVGVFLATWLVIKILTRFTVGTAQLIADRADKSANEDRFVQWRQTETWLSVGMALVRAIVVGVAAYVALRLLFPGQQLLPATIGISTFFIIIAGATVGPLLRDLTNGATMILGKWFSVGDFIKVEPFGEVNGVVERVTLRSTKLRNVKGDVVYVHNQHIMAVHVTPRGARSLRMEIFVRNLEKGVARVEEVIKTLPVRQTMVVSPLVIAEKEKMADNLWRISVTGQTAPGREWVVEDYAREAMQSHDKDKKEPLIVYGPLVHYDDAIAEKRFGRAVRRGSKTND